jgi:NAD+ diphosphatase
VLESKKFISGVVAPKERLEAALWFAFQADKLLVRPESSQVTIPCLVDFAELELPVLRQHYVGRLDRQHCYAVEAAQGIAAPQGMTFEGLRQIYGRMDEDLFAVAVRAIQIIDWDRTHQFCGRCGVRTRTHPSERAKECPQCGLLHFPRLAPAIIVLVERGPEMLLARARRFPTAMYSTIAGFVEPGETLEEAVIREVREETGITIKEIRYFGSQPWPFPHSLMIGFTATYADGQITLGDEENIDAGWFTADNLPSLPSKISIARKLIDWFLEKQRKALKTDPRHVETIYDISKEIS